MARFVLAWRSNYRFLHHCTIRNGLCANGKVGIDLHQPAKFQEILVRSTFSLSSAAAGLAALAMALRRDDKPKDASRNAP